MISTAEWEKRSASFRYPWLKQFRRTPRSRPLDNFINHRWYMLECAEGLIPTPPLGIVDAMTLILELGLSSDVSVEPNEDLTVDSWIPRHMGKYRRDRILSIDIYRYLCDLERHGYDKFIIGVDEMRDGESVREFPSHEEPRVVSTYKYVFSPGSYWPLCSYYYGVRESKEEEDVFEIVAENTPVKTLMAYTGPTNRIFLGTYSFFRGVLYKEINGKFVDTAYIPREEETYFTGIGDFPGEGNEINEAEGLFYEEEQ